MNNLFAGSAAPQPNRPQGVGGRSQKAPRGHAVQFYNSDTFLTGVVGDFLEEGLNAGEPLVVIATEPRRAALGRRLGARGLDLDRAHRNGQLTLMDAAETLACFMVGSTPDSDRFRSSVGAVIERRLSATGPGPVRAYGEMVDLLWKDGNIAGAIRLEELWNELAAEHDFSLLCAYAMGNFYSESHGEGFREICRRHTHVVPTERYVEADESARLVEISSLQQRAQALESEIEHRKELEHRLREALLERDDLVQRHAAARLEAEAASRAKSEFLAVMSHELRTPLNAIGGHVQLLEMGIHGAVTAQQHEALLRIARSQRHLLTLINNVLNLAHIESGHVEYAVMDVPIAPLLHDVTQMLEPLLTAKTLTCTVQGPKVAPIEGFIARADREKLQQILLNLLTNSIKFTPAGGRIVVTPEYDPHTPDVISIQVRDTGIGIDPAQLDSIFEPFVQLRTGRTIGQQEGVGLGLAISRDLARGMKGDLLAESVVGDGATFTLRLPRA